MTKTFFAIALIITQSAFVNAQTAARQTPADIERAVLQLEKDWIAAQLRADTAKLDELAAETLVYTHSSGGTDDKAAYLGRLKSGAVKYLSVDREEVRANVYGDSAVVTCKVMIKVRVNGEDRTVHMHYVDEGRGPIVLLLHGEPSWSYLYRKMIPVFTRAGYRAIAPDLIGFGRSDKPARQEDYSYAQHVAWLTAFLKQQRLRDITLVCQDWGGLIGLRVAAENPAWFARIVAANTGLPTGDQPPSPAFNQWLTFSQRTPNLDIGQILQRGSRSTLAPEIVAAYNAPFPDETYKAGARVFPRLVPIEPDDPAAPANRRAWQVLSQWKKPFLTAFSDGDAITRGGEQIMRQRIPGAQGQPHTIVNGAGHFLQEDKGEELANLIIAWMKPSK